MERWKTMERIPAPYLIPKFGPLTGMRILHSGSIVAAPFAAQLCADFGAELIHVELPQIGDTYRTQKPQISSEDGTKHMGAAYCQKRNKLSFALNTNMKIPEAREIFLSLIKQSDVWIENMVWIEKLGIDCKELLEINPKLVIVHVSGYGRPQFGGDPAICNRPSYDPIGLAESGQMNLFGNPPPEPPVYPIPFTNDYLTAIYAFGAILAGYINVLKGGLGQEIDLAQVETAARNLDDHWTSFINLGIEKSRAGSRVPIFQPASMHKCKDGRYAFIGAFGKAAYNRCIEGLGLSPEEYKWEEAGNSMEAINSEKGKALYAYIDKWFSERTAQEAQDHMDKFKTPVGIVKTPKDIYADPHWHSRGNFIKYHVPAIDREVEAFGFVPKFMDTPGQVWRGQVDIGFDTERILGEMLGYTDVEIESLKGRGIID